MNDPNLNAAAQTYGQLVSAFERATAPAAHPDLQSDDTLAQILILDIAGYRVRIRSTSRLLHDRLRHPLAHLEVAPDTVVPSFTVDFIDGSGLDDISLSLPVTAQQSSPEQETLEYQAGPYLFTLHGDSVLTAMNRDARRTVGIVRDPARWPLEHYQQAIFISLYQHLQVRGGLGRKAVRADVPGILLGNRRAADHDLDLIAQAGLLQRLDVGLEHRHRRGQEG